MDKLSKLVSKKFIALCLTTWLFYIGKLPPQYWLYIVMVYMGLDTGINILEKLLSKKEV